MSFKVGDKVRIVQPGIGVDEKNDGVGMVGTICSVPKYGWSAYGVDSPEFKTEKGQRGFDRLWWFEPHMLELVDDDQRSSVQTSQQSRCPRCQGELYEKMSVCYGPIKKCRDCGWC